MGLAMMSKTTPIRADEFALTWPQDESPSIRLCALLTCFNRRSQTVACLRALAASARRQATVWLRRLKHVSSAQSRIDGDSSCGHVKANSSARIGVVFDIIARPIQVPRMAMATPRAY